MTIINEHTTIANLLKQDPAALDAIVSISSRFQLLKNPVMRKLMAGRTTIAMATKIGGCSLHSFFEKLAPLGFRAELTAGPATACQAEMPPFIKSLKEEQITGLDVRPLLSNGKDPLKNIQAALSKIKKGEALKIINSFEPSPLIQLYEKKGFASWVQPVNEKLFFTYFYRTNSTRQSEPAPAPADSTHWDESRLTFEGRLQTIDVRMLEMPQPMVTILEALEKLPEGFALLVLHKRVPVFLLPHLEERNFDYQVKKLAEDEVQMLIYRR